MEKYLIISLNLHTDEEFYLFKYDDGYVNSKKINNNLA